MQIVNFRNELEKISEEIHLGNSNAFPWVTDYKNKLYLIFRSAPSHFPSMKSKSVILKSNDNGKWEVEHIFSINKDLREPRLINFKGKLFFFYSYAQKRLGIFRPESMMVSEKVAGKWTSPIQIFKKKLIMYSVKEIDGTIYMTCYNKKYGSECYFLKSKDGYNWENVFLNKNIEKYLTCETDFVFKNGFWYFVSRNEFGKFNIYGSEIYKFDTNGNLTKHIHSELKFDGPFLFERDNEIYLVARKNLANNGKFLLPIKPIRFWGYWISNLYYWITPKKTTIWKLNKETLETDFVVDLPSSGDTSYACVLQTEDKTKIYYYSSPIRPLKSWLAGQFGKTSIYSVEVV